MGSDSTAPHRHSLLTFVTLICCWSAGHVMVAHGYVAPGCDGQADVIFMLDSTGLFTPQKHSDAKNFIASQIDKLDIGENKTRVGVISLAGDGLPEVYLNDEYNKQGLISKVQQIPFRNAPTFDVINTLSTAEEIMMRKGKGGREHKVPALMAPVITRQPALDGPQDDSLFNFVMVNFEVGRWSADLPEPGESQGNTFFLRDPNELQTIDGPFNEKLCKEIPG